MKQLQGLCAACGAGAGGGALPVCSGSTGSGRCCRVRRCGDHGRCQHHPDPGGRGKLPELALRLRRHHHPAVPEHPGQGLKKNVTLNLVDCLVGITYDELGSIGSYVSASAAQQAWKAQAVAAHSYLEYHKQYGSSANALVYTPVDQIPSAAREAIRKAVEPVKDEILTYNGSVCDAVWSASAGYNTQTGVYGTCSSRDAWGTEVPYLQSVESPYEEQYHNLLRRSIGKDYTYVEYNDSRTGEPYTDADTTHKSLGGYVQYNTFVSNGRSYRYIGQFVSSRYCFDFGTDENGTPCMTYYGFGHGVGMSQCGAVGYAAERNMGYKAILRHYYKGASITSQGSSGGLFGWLRSLFG